MLQQTWQQTIHLEETQRKLSSLLQKKSLSENSESDEDKNVGEAEEAVNSEEDANLSLSDLTMSGSSCLQWTHFAIVMLYYVEISSKLKAQLMSCHLCLIY